MKKRMVTMAALFSLALFLPNPGWCESVDEIFDQFDQEFKSLVPRKGSSVDTDYKFSQTALATFYSTKVLSLIYRQNQDMYTKYDEILSKYDRIIEQNERIIELLTTLVKEGREEPALLD